MSNVTILFRGNDTVVELRGLKNEVTGDYLNAATVTATLVDADGAQVTGQTWPVTLTYVASSDGDYRATVSHLMALTQGSRYTLNLSANAGSGLVATWNISCVARTRD